MHVYFGENFWGSEEKRQNRVPGEAVWLEEQFEWMGREWRIPAVYLCEEGLVADICIRIPAEKIEAFLKKWRSRMEELSDEEWEEAHRENPMDEEFYEELRINGELSKGWSGCGVCRYPPYLLTDGEAINASEVGELSERPVEEQLMETYGCSRESSWRFLRQSWPWPDGVKMSVQSLDFTFRKGPVSYAGPHFRTAPGEKTSVEFVHPVSGTRHVLTVQRQSQSELPEEHLSALKQGQMRYCRMPAQFLTLEYIVEPEFSPDEIQVIDCAKSDPPLPQKENSAASVSVIGGADGPTSLFVMGNSAQKASGWRSACSALHYDPVEEVEWRICFHIKSCESKELHIKVEPPTVPGMCRSDEGSGRGSFS